MFFIELIISMLFFPVILALIFGVFWCLFGMVSILIDIHMLKKLRKINLLFKHTVNYDLFLFFENPEKFKDEGNLYEYLTPKLKKMYHEVDKYKI